MVILIYMRYTHMNTLVIGANYGDEGKGRTVDYLAKELLKGEQTKQIINVRFSGSNNAAHTVWKDGKSFVFHLLGAASFNDIPTYLGPDVVIDVVALDNELAKFKLLTGKDAYVYVDPRCRVNLPYDVMLNRVKELDRGVSKHGSTGNGLNETIDRNKTFPINVAMFNYSYHLIELARHEFKHSMAEYDLTKFNKEHIDFINFLLTNESSQYIFNKVRQIIDNNKSIIAITPPLHIYNCIFEGSQGLALDEYSEYYPHVTRTRTGSHNAIDICREHNIEIDEAYYISRTYFTRHGADPSFKEFSGIHDHFNIVDETNIPNEWQDSLRFGILDIDDMEKRVGADFKLLQSQFAKVKQTRVFTCLDQNKGNGAGLYIRDCSMYQSDDMKHSLELLYSLRKYGNVSLKFFDNKENA